MARLKNRRPTIRSLFSSSGNQCAFPGCEHELINHKNQLVAQICHINSASIGGERHDSDLSDEALRSFENLMIMCYAHHIETNDVAEYPVERLQKIKAQHESMHSTNDFSIPKIALEDALFQENDFWQNILRVNSTDHVFEELKFDIDPDASFYKAVHQLRDSLTGLHHLVSTFTKTDEELPADLVALFARLELDFSLLEKIPYYENPFEQRNWEYHNIGVPNWTREIEIRLLQVEIKHYEVLARAIDLPEHILDRLGLARDKLLDMAQHELRVD